jgi:glutathione S-transferase
MSTKVWGHAKSGNVQKVLWSLEELSVPFERIDAGGPFGRVREADYLKLNPNGLVPTLEDDGVVLWESHAIVRYLFAKHGAAPAYPDGPAARARADAWTDWAGNTFWPVVRALVVQAFRTKAAERDERAIATAVTGAGAALAILDDELRARPYLAGNDFTYGDVSLAVAARRWFELPTEAPFARPAAPAFEAWYARIAARPAFERWVAVPFV